MEGPYRSWLLGDTVLRCGLSAFVWVLLYLLPECITFHVGTRSLFELVPLCSEIFDLFPHLLVLAAKGVHLFCKASRDGFALRLGQPIDGSQDDLQGTLGFLLASVEQVVDILFSAPDKSRLWYCCLL